MNIDKICNLCVCANNSKKRTETGCNLLNVLENIKFHYLEYTNQIEGKDEEINSLKKLSKNQIKEKDLEIVSLKKLNKELYKKIDDLQNEITSLKQLGSDTKRRKTNSFDSSSVLEASKIFRQVNILDNLNNNESLGITYSENLMKTNSPTNLNDNQSSNLIRCQDFQTPNKKEININNILSPIENKISLTPNNSMLLPKMLRRSANKNSPNNEWISKSKLKQDSEKCKNKINWEMSCIQPIKMISSINENKKNDLDSSSDIIACSQNDPQENKRKDRIKSKLKTSNRLKQTKLEFEHILSITPKVMKIRNDETLCDDFIDASPVLKDIKPVRTLRKLTRKNSDEELFDFKNTKKSQTNTMSTNNQDGITCTPETVLHSEIQIKKEPVTIRKKSDTDKINKEAILVETKTNVNETDFQICDNIKETEEKISTSSCYILPQVDDDVLCVDDSENLHFDVNTADLFIEMIRQGDETQPILKEMEKQQLKNMNMLDKKDKKKMPNLNITFNDRKTITYIDSDEDNDGDITHCNTFEQQKLDNLCKNIELEHKNVKIENNSSKESNSNNSDSNINNHDCNECSAYKNYLIRTGCSEAEIAERLRNCKKHKVLKLHSTPENFWEPRLLSFPENDPRNEVLVDYRFHNKENKQ